MSERIGTDKIQKTAGAVNPEFHHEFEALCALYSSGDLSEEEWALLQIHMGYCDRCHEKFLEYQQITDDLMPLLAAAAANGKEPLQEPGAARQRPRHRVPVAGQAEPEIGERAPLRPHWKLPVLVLAAAAAGLACLLGVRFLRLQTAQTQLAVARSGQSSVNSAPRENSASPHSPDDQKKLQRDQDQIALLEHRLASADVRLRGADARVESLEKNLDEEQSARQQISDQKGALIEQLTAAQTELAAARQRLTSVESQAAEQKLRRTALESRLDQLQADVEERDTALNEKDRMLALDKDFLAHDRDIRDLIGARKLYIADIFDTTQSGKTARQFGRIFYTKDRSLIFYGFDLDSQAGRNHDVSYQVWGSGSGRSSPISLGLFYQDSSHKRWVLRCNDPKALARLDMVFVTVEPPGGSARPTGKRLLRAYLQIRPNHP